MTKPKATSNVWQIVLPFGQPFWRSSIYVRGGQGWYSGKYKTQTAARRAMKAAAKALNISIIDNTAKGK